VPNFIPFAVPIAELAHGEKLRSQSLSLTHLLTHSITQLPNLFDAPGTEAFASEK